MKNNLFLSILVCSILAIPSLLTAKVQAGNDVDERKSIRIFLSTGETIDIDAAKVDSITMTTKTQCFWEAGAYKSINIEEIDSIWYITPTLRITTKEVNFGKVAVGNAKSTTVTITNTGEYPETYILLADGVFNANGSGTKFVIGAGQSRSVDLSFLPTETIEYKGDLLVLSSAVEDGKMRLPLVGLGVSSAGEEENAILPPVEQDTEIELIEGLTPNDFSGFKIVNSYGEFPLGNSSIASARGITGEDNGFYSPVSVSPNGLQLHTLLDAQDNPYLFSISLPNKELRISVEETAIALIMIDPLFITSNDAEFHNAVKYIKGLNSFKDYVEQVRTAYLYGIEHNQCPDYSSVDIQPLKEELKQSLTDNRIKTLSGVSLEGLDVTPFSAKYRIHNDMKRVLHIYPKRVKVNEANGVPVEWEDASDTMLDLCDKLIQKVKDQALSYDINFSFLDDEDEEFLNDFKSMVIEIESQVLSSTIDGIVPHIHFPVTLESTKADYWKIVWDFWVDDLLFDDEHEESIYEAVTDEITTEFKDYDKLFVDVYGIGYPNKDLSLYTEEELFRLILVLIHGGYRDYVSPFIDLVSGCKKVSKGIPETYKYDLRYGARKYPERAFVLKLYKDFMKKPENKRKLMQKIAQFDWKGVLEQIIKFSMKTILKSPSEDKDDDKRTYANLIYNMYKKYTGGNRVMSLAFRNNFKSAVNTIVKAKGGIDRILATIDLSETVIDINGTIESLWYKNKCQEQFVINKYARPYIEVIEPKYTPATTEQTIQFKWQTYKANYTSKFVYDLVFAVETPDDFVPFTVMSNINATSCDVNLGNINEIRNAPKILFQLIAHHPDNPETVYAKTEFLTLVSLFSADIPKFVDLGLPSGTLWAVSNLGAAQNVEYGNYYAWGETDTKTSYTWKNYKYCKGTSTTLTKYCTKESYGNNNYTDDFVRLQGSDDPLCQKYGYFYSIPTKEDWDELIENCSWTQLEDGVMVRGKKVNGKYQDIFLPSAGYRGGLELHDANSDGYYWSSTLDQNSPDDAWFLYFGKGKPKNNGYYRCYGRSIRPVIHTNNSVQSASRQTTERKADTPVEKKFDGMVVKSMSHSSATK